MKLRSKIASISIATSFALIAATPAFAGSISGSGASFPQTFIDSCAKEFARTTGDTVNYPAGGSSKGRSDFSANLVDFAASDAPYSSGAPANLVYVPAFAAPIAVMYNLPTVKEPINLDPATIARIFSGQITNWNDPIIALQNEKRTIKTPVYKTKQTKVTVGGKTTTKTVDVLDKNGKPILLRTITKTVNIDLPDLAITVWYRTDGSGTSENFTKWLKANNDLDGAAYWNRSGNTTFTSSTPVDIATKFNFQGASGSSLVAKNASQKVGSITYSELEWAKLNNLAVANIKNRAGEYVPPSSAATAVFLGAATINANGTLSYDFTKSIPGAYSLGIASYAMVYPEASKKDAAKQKIVKDFLSFVVEGCHAKFPDQGFTQLSGPLLAKAKEQLALIK